MTVTVLSGAILMKALGIGWSLAGASAAKTDMGIYVAITSAPPSAAEAFNRSRRVGRGASRAGICLIMAQAFIVAAASWMAARMRT